MISSDLDSGFRLGAAPSQPTGHCGTLGSVMERHQRAAFIDPLLTQVPSEVARDAPALPRLGDGRVDYSSSLHAAVLDCYVYRRQEMLVLKRRDSLGGLERPWHVVSGFLDRLLPLCDMALAEIFEETGQQKVLSLHALAPYCSRDTKLWTIYPLAAELAAGGEIRLNEEHSDFAWIPFDAAAGYLLPHVYGVWLEHRKRIGKFGLIQPSAITLPVRLPD